jgi:hypothetical protein
MKQSNGSRKPDKPRKPHPDFPLFPHATKRWAKKIRGTFHFFGPWRDPQGALEEWLRVKDELLAGRKPRPKNNEGCVTVELVVNAFLTHKERLRDDRDIQPRTFTELKTTGVRIADAFGKQRLASDLQPSDFAESANVPMKAMILLGTNCGLGNNDVARLSRSNVDLKTGWLVFPRPKTGVPRRAKLWSETIAAIELVLKKRPEPKDPADADFVFVTKMKSSWAKETAGNNPVSLMFKKLLKDEELYRPGVGFYSLRRTFETVAGETLDQPAVDLVMGHTPHANDMAARYRQRIGDERLEKVAEHVRKWLFSHATASRTTSSKTFAKNLKASNSEKR